MRSISVYARHRYVLARIFIAVAHFLLVAASVYIGTTLTQLGVEISIYVLIVGGVFAITSLLLNRQKIKTYWRQRLAFVLLAAGIFLCSCFVFNNNRITSYNVYSHVNGIVPKKVTQTTKTSTSNKKQLRMLLKELRFELRHSDGNAGKIIGTILVILGAILLLFALAAASCSIACSGAEALAVIVALLGTVGVIWLTVWAIKKINKKKIPPPVNATTQ
jgi:hypothetical protein